MFDWLLLATRWRKDGTPLPNRKLISALEEGDPLAFIYLGAAILVIFVLPAIYRRVRGR
jgi:hypothetical protein